MKFLIVCVSRGLISTLQDNDPMSRLMLLRQPSQSSRVHTSLPHSTKKCLSKYVTILQVCPAEASELTILLVDSVLVYSLQFTHCTLLGHHNVEQCSMNSLMFRTQAPQKDLYVTTLNNVYKLPQKDLYVTSLNNRTFGDGGR